MPTKTGRAVRAVAAILAATLTAQAPLAVAAELSIDAVQVTEAAAITPVTTMSDADCSATPSNISPLALYQVDPSRPASDVNQARLEGEQDGRRDVSGAKWFVLGCLFGLFTVIAAYVHDPDPPAARVVGRSTEYHTVYSDTWRRTSKGKRTRNAWLGTAAGVLLTVALINAAESGNSRRR